MSYENQDLVSSFCVLLSSAPNVTLILLFLSFPLPQIPILPIAYRVALFRRISNLAVPSSLSTSWLTC